MTNYSIKERTFDFAIKVVIHHKKLVKKETILSKQLIRSGTSIGANVAEAESAQSKADFIHKLSISEKESSETDYWLKLLHKTGYITNEDFKILQSENEQILRILKAIIKKTKANLSK